jgi:uncharacterized protein (DUF2141 family)
MACNLVWSVSLTGDCEINSSGAFNLDIIGDSPDFSIQWAYPRTDLVALGPGVTSYSETGLSAGTYTFQLIDTCTPSPTISIVSFNISSGTCVSISNHVDTSCGLNSGSLTAQLSQRYGLATFYVYEQTNGFYISANSSFDQYTTSVPSGIWYVVADDGGGCTGRSETCIILSSTTFDFGFYVVNDSACFANSGKLFVTGLTGNPPYTYLWSNGQTTPSISGLTYGTYDVTVTDSNNCQVNKTVLVQIVEALGQVAVTQTAPSCYGTDGVITLYLSGGTAPFRYQLSNGFEDISFSSSYTFTNLAAGPYTITVTDAGLCTTTVPVSLAISGGFSLLSLTVTDSVCDNSQGAITVNLFGGTPDYTFVLSNSNGFSQTLVSITPTTTFSGLQSGTYDLNISDNGPCTFYQSVTVNTVDNFSIQLTVTNADCVSPNGSVFIDVFGTSSTYTYSLNGVAPVTTSNTNYTFNGLAIGTYYVTVTDETGCQIQETFNVDAPAPIEFSLQGINPTNGFNGIVTAFITQGEPPFTLTWSNNVNGQTGLTVIDLPAGTYSLTVTDSNGCTLTKDITLVGAITFSSSQSFNICDGNIQNDGIVVKKGLKEMLVEGFLDLTAGDTNCILNQTTWTVEVTVGAVVLSQIFYTGYDLGDYPTDNMFFEVVRILLLQIPGIDEVIFNYPNGTITIIAGCGINQNNLSDLVVNVAIKILYDISCVACNVACIKVCDVLFASDGDVYDFNPSTNLYEALPSTTQYTASLGVTRSDTKLWVLDSGGNSIFEYDINSLCPIDLSYNREIVLSQTLTNGLSYIDPNTLLCSVSGVYDLMQVDLSTGTVTSKFNLSVVPMTEIKNSISFTDSGKILITTFDIDNNNFLNQYDSLGNLEVQALLPPGSAYSVFQIATTLYVMNQDDLRVYSVDMSSPYTVTFEYVMPSPPSPTTLLVGNQYYECITEELIP